ncbi:UbiA prenyltransferase family protein [Flavobacterium agrisoli]|uniref:Prenyltransferase n=1 Tax=Flavobacterium agrisoli TaxID=2793066 RepID=A0A934PNU9_9FLAO|nr:hypothetical protein [Flavobacterium agrisoli]MBK0370987.1 hypothetical protein [Flavobacterium agrisoli]
MKFFLRLIDFYINSSLHVALSAATLVALTYEMFALSTDLNVVLFVFFGTIVGYNFVKYDALVRIQRINMKIALRAITVLSFLALLLSGYFFLHLQSITQISSVIIVLITLLYALPFFPNKKNARNWAGVKIYIVSICWVGATVVLPILNAEIGFSGYFFIKCLQRFILIFVLILIFEIVDVENDDPHLQTVPQQIGVNKTKLLGLGLLVPFYFLEFANVNFNQKEAVVNLIMVVVLSALLAWANSDRNKYYSSFFTEAIPIFWWILMVIF